MSCTCSTPSLHWLMAELHERMRLDTATCGVVTTAAEACREGLGGCQD
jgi:hypothetical protein